MTAAARRLDEAAARLLADGGITALGRHWCTRPHRGCPHRREN